ncbi:MAG: PAS domain-containing protein, partial [Anaerolineae bacterium]|nr:PAS domain-containing protein [Anaerolineae bacterium]
MGPALFLFPALISLLFSIHLISRRKAPGSLFYALGALLAAAWCALEAALASLLVPFPQTLVTGLRLFLIMALPGLLLAGVLDQTGQWLRVRRWQMGMVGAPVAVMLLSWTQPVEARSQHALTVLLPNSPPAVTSFALAFILPFALFTIGYVMIRRWGGLSPVQRLVLSLALLIPPAALLGTALVHADLLVSLMPALFPISLFGFAASFTGGNSPYSYGMFGREESLINRLAVAVVIIDPSGRIVDLNETAAAWAGMARQGLIGRPVYDFSRQLGRILLESRRGVTLDQDIFLDGLVPPRHCHLHVSEEAWQADQTLRLITLEDHSRFAKEFNDLRRDRALLEASLEGNQSGLMVTDPNGRVILRTAALLQTFSLPERAFDTGLLGWRNQMAQVMKDQTRFHRFLDQTITQGVGETLEMMEMASGRWLECHSHTITLPGTELIYRLWSFTDYTEQARREQELERISTHDAMTGVYNRAFFENELRRMRLARRYPVSL